MITSGKWFNDTTCSHMWKNIWCMLQCQAVTGALGLQPSSCFPKTASVTSDTSTESWNSRGRTIWAQGSNDFLYLIPMCNILEILVAFAHDDKVVVCSLVFGQVGQGLSVRCFAKLQFVLSRASWRTTWYQRGAVLQQIPNPCLNICRKTLSLLCEAGRAMPR